MAGKFRRSASGGAAMSRSCNDCCTPIYKSNKSGFCRSCRLKRLNKEASFIALQLANRTWTEARQIAASNREKKPLSIRFSALIGHPDNNGCIEWRGAKDHRGYGWFSFNGKNGRATHAALLLAGFPQPSPKHQACHKCDNPGCVNADHLWWGTQSENMQDCKAKGRLNDKGLVLGRQIRLENCRRKGAAA